MKNIKSKWQILMLVLIISVFLIANFNLINVKAFGVTPPYLQENPGVEVIPGETVDTFVGLQNMVGGENITLRAKLIAGSEIVEIIDESNEYFVPFGSKDVKVNLRITIPADAQIGREYPVALALTTITPGSKGAVGIGLSIETEFPVIVKSQFEHSPEKKAFLGEWRYISAGIVILIVIIILIIWLLTRKKRKYQKR